MIDERYILLKYREIRMTAFFTRYPLLITCHSSQSLIQRHIPVALSTPGGEKLRDRVGIILSIDLARIIDVNVSGVDPND